MPNRQPVMNWRGGGASDGFPSGVPPSAQPASVAISLSVMCRSLRNGRPPVIFHGGIWCGSRVLLDVVGPVDRLLEGHQRKGSDLAGAMALLAVGSAGWGPRPGSR